MGQVATKARVVAPRRRRRGRSFAEQLNERLLGIREWVARTTPLFSAAPAIGMNGDDERAAQHLEMLGAYADQLSRDLFRLNQRGWGPKAPETGRDARLPAIGSKLTRDYRGKRHTVQITATGLKYRGRTYPSISAVGKRITRAATNGYKFFRLAP